MPKKLLLENTTCGRCGGTGRMPFMVANGVCFKCTGWGAVLTKRGRAAQAFLNALRLRRLDEFAVGDTYLSQGFNAGSYVEPDRWIKIDRIESGMSSHTVNGQHVFCITLHGADVKRGDRSSFSGAPDATLRKAFTAEERREQAQMALEYQATLTKAGKPRHLIALEAA